MKKALLILEDGSVWKGLGFGANREVYGELVFNTGMTGYVESLTDPSYAGQILMFTYPLIGNYGVTSQDYESDGIKVEGLVVKQLCRNPSNWRSEKDLEEFLLEYNIPAISGVDTRLLTRKIRIHGTVKSRLVVYEDEKPDVKELIQKTIEQKDITEIELVSGVSTKNPKPFKSKNNKSKNIVVIDCGIKKSIILQLLNYANVLLVPYNTNFKEILDYSPDGVLISNGPGDPSVVKDTVETVKKLIGKLPLFGICLGHQIICLANRAKTFKLKFGHRGANQPVLDLASGKVFITSQNHGFAVDKQTLKGTDLEVTQINLNDGTVEGVKNDDLKIISVQYHPEASPGPHDTYQFFKVIDVL